MQEIRCSETQGLASLLGVLTLGRPGQNALRQALPGCGEGELAWGRAQGLLLTQAGLRLLLPFPLEMTSCAC